MPRLGYEEISTVPEIEIMAHSSEAKPVSSADLREREKRSWSHVTLFATISFVGLLFLAIAAMRPEPLSGTMEGNAQQKADTAAALGHTAFDAQGRVELMDYDSSKPFSSFLPAVGGKFGVPMWAFFVNRGQAITTFGTENKDKPIMEFNSANKAYEYAPSEGFRTFLRYTFNGEETKTKEPFKPIDPMGVEGEVYKPDRRMFVGMNELEIQEVDKEANIQTNALYFTVPNEEFPALVRRVTITNIHADKSLHLDLLDGQTKLEPSGADDWHLKNMGRTLEAWMNVYNMPESGNTQPFFKLSLSLADTAEVTKIVEGHWALAMKESFEEERNGDYRLLPFIVDPTVIFGQDTSFRTPVNFLRKSLSELLQQPQVTTSKTPCAFVSSSAYLQPGESVTVSIVLGRAPNMDYFKQIIAPRVKQTNFVLEKKQQAVQLLQDLTNKVGMRSASPGFDRYVRQMYLDNLLRGGYPYVLGDEENPRVFHTFSRIHGDMERDYNYFQIDASYFSMGPGNFRDVNQNRRCDVLQEPRVNNFNLNMFLSYVQADGYNPLTVESAYFFLPDVKNHTTSELADEIARKSCSNPDQQLKLATILCWPAWRPGDLFIAFNVQGVDLDLISKEDFVTLATSKAQITANAQYNQDGFWADHWTYHMDLLDTYLTVYPDKEEELLFGKTGMVPFYFAPVKCLPRDLKYVEVPGEGPRQYDFIEQDQDKVDSIAKHVAKWLPTATWQRGEDGRVYEVSIFAKLLMLAVNKFSIMDPLGMGVEYEGGKPGWNDAMNGLPGLFGSGMPETFEALRIFQFLDKILAAYPTQSVEVPGEFKQLIEALDVELKEYEKNQDDHGYWDRTHTALEKYREASKLTFGGKVEVTHDELAPFLELVITKMEAGVRRAVDLNGGTTPTYWIFTPTEYDVLDNVDFMGRNYIRVNKFEPSKVPLFLEGPVRQMKVVKSSNERLQVYNMIKGSNLYDRKLKQYTISESLSGMSYQIGRMMAFAPGWLENQSVWLHMSYKLYLEMLRGGLFDLFFEELKTGLTAFMDPEVYGRSPIECSSFIASSAHPDTSIHGQGFLARLSGSTAEFMSMWNLMMMGPAPFTVKDSKLSLSLKPTLPSWLFFDDGTVEFTFLGSIPVTYHNPTRTNTWEEGMAVATAVVVDENRNSVEFPGGVISDEYARLARDGKLQSIDIHLEFVQEEAAEEL